MSKSVRNIVLATALVAATGASFAARQGHDATLANPLSVRMLADASSDRAFMGTVEFRVTNNSAETLSVPYWQLPSASDEGKLFQVLHDGKPATYLGPMIKRAAPTESDLVTFQPYESKLVTVDLTKSYDLSKKGEYSVAFISFLDGARTRSGRRLASGNGRMATLQSVPLKLWVDAGHPLRSLRDQDTAKPKASSVVNGITYVGCSSSRITSAGAGVTKARSYSENAKGYLVAGKKAARYTSWFGAYTSSRYSTVNQHFTKIDTAMDQTGGKIKINCGCTDNYYAYVYPTRPYEIFVCNAFWSAPTSGTDSKAGTLIHEMSHFNVVAGTDDWVYGQSGAKNLAITNPTRAVDNADSHEYFAENTPAQN